MSNHRVLPKARFKSTPPTPDDIRALSGVRLLSSLESMQKRTMAQQHDILMLFQEQCTLVKSGVVHSGSMQWIMVRSDEFKNSYPLLYTKFF